MKPDYSQPIIATATGGYVNLIDPNPKDIRLRDIAAALSKLCRFTGHTNKFYSVAEHSVRAARYLRAAGYTPATQLAGLLHDASEAYLGDVGTPLKKIMPQYRALEHHMELCIQERFNVVFMGRPEIKEADLLMLAAEKKILLPHEKNEWPVISHINPDTYLECHRYMGQAPKHAEESFLHAFNHLVKADLTGYWTPEKIAEVL